MIFSKHLPQHICWGFFCIKILSHGIIFHMASAKKTSSYCALIVYIGSGSVSSCLAQFTSKNKPLIIASSQTQMPIEEPETGNMYVKRMISAIGKCLEELTKKSGVVPTKIYVSLGSPWFTGQTRIIHYAKKSPFTITAKLGDELIETDKARFVAELEEISDGETLDALDSTIIESKVNGYSVPSPLGLRGRELTMTVYVSIMPKNVSGEVRHAIEHYYRAQIGFFSEQIASYSASRSLTNKNSYLLLAVGDESSELSLVTNNVLKGNAHFPLGKFFLLRTLMSELKQNP